ncbi:MAG: preprotein translocase subunit YajC [Gammaproteobacteria bacterium]|nr:preprotein translocase subunit YajC [Gammaproteobacteria bacterium]
MIDMPEFAYAATPAGGGGWSLFLLLGGMFVIMYFLMIRPQSKRRKEHQALVSSLSKGDEVVTIGGITGHVTKVEEGFVKIKVANNVELRMQKSSVNASLPKGTLKSLEED